MAGILGGVRRHLARKAGAMTGLAVTAVGGAVLVLAWILAGPAGWSAGTAVPLVLVLLAGAALLALLGWIGVRLWRWTNEPNLTGEVERSVRLPQGAVRAQVELDRALPPGVSRGLARAGEARLLERLTDPPSRLAAGSSREANRFLGVAGGIAAASVLLVAGLWFLAPDRAVRAWAGLAHPAALLQPEPLPALDVRPGDAELPRGSVPELEALAGGRDSVTFHWQGVGEVAREETVSVEEGRARFALTPLEVRVTYWVSAPDGAVTTRHRLVPLEPSLLTDLQIEAHYPGYTRLPTEVFRGVPSSLRIPEGTELRLSGEVQGEGERVRLEAEGEGPVAEFAVSDGRFSGSWRPARSISASWAVEGGREGAVPPPPLRVEVRPDEPPEVALPVPGGDADLPVTLRVPLLLEAADDWGVRWVELEATVRGPGGGEAEPVVDRIETGDRTRVSVRPTLDFAGWGLEPGDEVLLRARAADNAPSPQVAETPVYRLRMPDRRELREAARGRLEAAAGRAEELADRATREAREFRELEQRARTGREDRPGDAGSPETFREREELRDAAERQSELAREVEELREGLEEARRGLEGEDRESFALRERFQELERLLDEILGPEDRARMEELLERLRSGEPDDVPSEELLEELARRQEEMRDRLEDALERLRRTAMEESFRGAEEETRALAEAQEEVAERLREGEGIEEQEALADRTQALEERLEELEERLREHGDPEAGERAGEAARDLDRARESMERAAEAGQAGEPAEAGERGDEAAGQVQEALERMEEARAEWLEEWEERIRESLRRGAEDALALARRQGELREEMEGAGPARRSELQGEEAALRQGLRNLANSMAMATRQVPGVGREISEAIGGALDAVERTIEGLATGRSAPGGAGEAAQEAQAAMNQVALAALDGVEGVGEQPDMRSLDQLMDELEALAGQQQALNEEAGALAEEPGGEGFGEELDELAALQEAIARALEEMAHRPEAERSPGDMEEMAREGEDIAREMEGGRLDATTLDRQERLLDRLLAAGRTLEMEGPTEEREGTPAGPVERSAVEPLSEEVLRSFSLPLPSASELEALTPGQRRLVLEYLERVRRDRGGSP